ncbi:protein-tyrosine-phosphatase IBR5-like [Panicum miliaceum]|uniref:Protein-tyrosine-phosphatase IBR5-like n=1 Tax=Panicum miliaceum TaxID=4540 RepID=A0A3L6QFL3_PANMI|nr:protein-tyrosine-phosphatase IBR5-like [Panicum miliaceum]
MRKRERENPCGICGHYLKFEEGEVCGVCGHRWKPSDGEGTPARHESAFPTEVLKDFLFLGSYDNASLSEVLKTLGISRILNTVPDCYNLYQNSFTYHSLQRDRPLDFDGAIQFLASLNELLEYKQKLFGLSAEPVIPTESFASLGFSYTKPADDTQAPAFNQMTAPSIFQRVGPNDIPANFAFGAERTVGVNPQDSDNNGGTNPASTDNVMDSS